MGVGLAAERGGAMNPAATLWLTVVAMIAFAANSLLCRLALRDTGIDAATFTTIRIAAGSLILWGIVRMRHGRGRVAGDWVSATALFAYAAGFSYAYLSLEAGTGALLLFGAVQATMIGYGLARGERLSRGAVVGLVLAAGGLIGLLLPGLSAPPLAGALLMGTAGFAWGIYSLRGRGGGFPVYENTQVTYFPSGEAKFAALLPQLGLIPRAMAQAADYRALVCIYLAGANDSYNWLVPRDADAAGSHYDRYRTARGGVWSGSNTAGLALGFDDLLPIQPSGGAAFGLHPSCGDFTAVTGDSSQNHGGIQSLFNQGKAAFVCNAGPLVQPISKLEYNAGAPRPPHEPSDSNAPPRESPRSTRPGRTSTAS